MNVERKSINILRSGQCQAPFAFYVEKDATSHPEPPRGTFPAKCDPKGRVTLARPIITYLEELGEKRVYITTFNLLTARVYPLSRWRANETFFDNFSDDPQAAEDVNFIAQEFGADSDIDGQGRILFPTELRRRLGMENQPVWLVHYKGGFTVYSQQLHEQRMQRALNRLEEKVDLLTKRGLL